MRIKDSLRDLRDNIKCSNIPIIGVSGEEEKEAGPQKIVEEMIVINSPRLGKEIVTQVQEMQSPIQDKPK